MELITAKQLSERWNLSEGTIANWRSQKKGPKFTKQFKKVVYKMKDVLTFEKQNKIIV